MRAAIWSRNSEANRAATGGPSTTPPNTNSSGASHSSDGVHRRIAQHRQLRQGIFR